MLAACHMSEKINSLTTLCRHLPQDTRAVLAGLRYAVPGSSHQLHISVRLSSLNCTQLRRVLYFDMLLQAEQCACARTCFPDD